MKREYDLFNGVTVRIGGWASKWLGQRKLKQALHEWVAHSFETGRQEPDFDTKNNWIRHQCGGCSNFAAFDSDYGLCANPQSPNDGRVVFEHGGCVKHSDFETLPQEVVQEVVRE